MNTRDALDAFIRDVGSASPTGMTNAAIQFLCRQVDGCEYNTVDGMNAMGEANKLLKLRADDRRKP